MKLSRCLLFISALLCSFSAQALYIQMEDDGFIIAYTYDQFLTGNNGIILGQVPAYGDDAGFFYDTTMDRYIQMEDDGFIIAYTYDQFLTGNNGIILGQVPAYGDDAGFFYDTTMDRYIQMEDDGFIIAYTYDQFLTGNNGIILGQVPAYGDDAGFFVVPDDMEEPTVPAPMTPLLLGLGLVALVVSRRRGAATRTGD